MTRGLMGTWDFDATNDFTAPDGTFATQTALVDTNIRSTHDWAMKCKSTLETWYLQGKKVSKYRAASQHYIISDVGESWEDRKFDCNVYLSLSIYINSSVITESYCILIEVWWIDVSGVLHDKETENIGRSLFTHSNGQSSNTFFDKDWLPEFDFKPLLPDNV